MSIQIKNTIYNNKPNDLRLDKEMRVYELLEKLEIPFCRLDHEAADTIEDCSEIDKLLETNMCKNLFLCNSQKTAFYLLLIQGDKKFKTSVLSKQINTARLSFASADFMEKFLDITPGAVSIMGLMNDKEHNVRLLIDKDVAKEEFIGCHPCVNTSSLKIKTSDIIEKFLPYTGHKPEYVEL